MCISSHTYIIVYLILTTDINYLSDYTHILIINLKLYNYRILCTYKTITCTSSNVEFTILLNSLWVLVLGLKPISGEMVRECFLTVDCQCGYGSDISCGHFQFGAKPLNCACVASASRQNNMARSAA